jgi:hypothetical protein
MWLFHSSFTMLRRVLVCVGDRDGALLYPLRHPAFMAVVPLNGGHVPSILAAFGLGSWGRLSEGALASGRLGSIWRLDTECGSWALKQVGDIPDEDLAALLEGAAFQEAALAAGVPTPAVRRTGVGELIADCGGARVRLHAWVDLHPPDASLDGVEVGLLVAALHRVDFEGGVGLDSWYTEPVGAARWADLVTARFASSRAGRHGGVPRRSTARPTNLSPRPLG